ncbi:PepSY domain-containing protein [Methanobacterium sp. ACI-7]|uniref:PepSY domain-containing protein n=1 Tax=unclassified Methanobacterium TaxID=2627676 RepID=UPI0039C13DC3
MKNKSVLSFIAILVLIVGISGCVEDNPNTTNTSNQTVQQNSSANNNVSAVNVKISSEEAKNIAKKYINQSGATPGEPMLKTEGDKIYIVPIIVNGNNAGEIFIDAQTGENKGGIGGVT